MKTKPSNNAHHEPTCRKCGGTDIDFIYTENNHGDEIDETSVLSGACYRIGEAINDVISNDWDAATIADMGKTLSGLAHMLRVRQERDAKAKDAAPEMPS